MNSYQLNYVVPMSTVNSLPEMNIDIVRAENENLFDSTSKKYVDLRSGLWNVSLGYNQELNERITSSFNDLLLNNLPFLDIHGYRHHFYDLYSKELLDFMNDKTTNFKKVFYTNSGSEGTELAIKLSRQINTHGKILAFDEGYHGTYFGGMSVSGLDQSVSEIYEPKIADVEFVSSPQTDLELDNLLSQLSNDKEITTFFIEPVIGSGGTVVIQNNRLDKIIKTCRDNKITVVFDEVATGFYRTGERFKYLELKEKPDIVILSKSINNGILPFGAVVINEYIVKKLHNHHIEHFSTQNGNLLGIASALETLQFYKEKEGIIQNNVRKLEKIFSEVLTSFNIEYRSSGAMFSIPLDNVTSKNQIMDKLKRLGIIVYHFIQKDGSCGLTLFPSLLINHFIFEKSMKLISKTILKEQ